MQSRYSARRSVSPAPHRATQERSVTVLINLPVAGAGSTAMKEEPLYGNPVEADGLRGIAGEGIIHLPFLFNPNTFGRLEALRPAIELLDRG